MIAKVLSATPYGTIARPIEVEADSKQGLPGIQVIGMADKAVSEARERVRSALKQSNLPLPARKYTVGLAPASIRKDGAQFDVAIAIALLVASGAIKQSEVRDCCFIGELSLDGSIKPVRGVIATALLYQGSSTRLFVPLDNTAQAQLLDGVMIYAVATLSDLFLHLKSERVLSPLIHTAPNMKISQGKLLDSIVGQDSAKRALQIAAAGNHNILLYGPPGSGKSLLAKALIELLPPLSLEEQLIATSLHSNAMHTETTQLMTQRPYRAPHHTISTSSLLGAARAMRPGEISLAHSGILHLDELPEFPRTTLESLRQPIEDGKITISRFNDSITYPASFLLIATMNPCPCGYYGDSEKNCICSEYERARYKKRISGPLFDRFDIVVNINRLNTNELSRTKLLHTTQHSYLYQGVLNANNAKNSKKISRHNDNEKSTHSQTDVVLDFQPDALELLHSAVLALHISTRGHFKIMNVARTIADIESSAMVTTSHVAEALQLRPSSAPF